MQKTDVKELDSDDAVVRVPRPPSSEHTQRPKSSLRRRQDSQTSYSSSSASSSMYSSSARTSHSGEIAVQTGPELLHDYDPEADILTEGDRVTYQVNVYTGNRLGASTRAEVKVVLIGQNGRTEEIYLEDSKLHKVPFQKGQEDDFRVDCFDLGPLKRIIIGHDRKQIACGWFLDRVCVRNLKARVEYLVECGKWLSSTDGDGRTFKEFPFTSASGYREEEVHHTPSPPPPRRTISQPSEPRVVFSEATDSRYSMDPEATIRAGSPKLINSASTFNDSNKNARLKTLEQHLEERKRSSQASPSHFKSPRVPRRDDFFDQSVQEKDYSSVIESLSTATDQDNKDDFVTDHVDYHQGEELSTEPRLRDEPRVIRESREERNRPLDDDTARISTSAIDSTQGHLFMDGFQAGLAASKKDELEGEVKKDEVPSGPSVHSAAQSGNLNRLKAIVELRPEDKTRPNEQGWTPLHLAANNGQTDIVQYLSISVVDLDVTTPTGFTAMHMAASSGHTACMKVLSAMGAKIDSMGVDECTPLHQAAINGHLDCVKWLVANGASISAQDFSGRSALELAMSHQQEAVALFLRACEDDRANPQSSLAQIATRSDEERQSRTTGSPTVTPSHDSEEYSSDYEENEPNEPKLSKAEQQKHEQELGEKRKIYERQEHEKLRRDSSFLDSIRQQYEEGSL